MTEKTKQPFLEVGGLVKYFGSDKAVDGISFGVPKGKFLTLLGPSGCGKTTTLMCIAGLHKPDAGDIRIGGEPVTAIASGVFEPPERRNIGMVFQSYAIWPHMSVAQNVSYPLEIQKANPSEIADRTREALTLVGLADMADKSATQLSGGQQQRAALARAIVSHPRLLLFDEPLSNLDLKLREKMRVELKRIQHEVGITSVYVTHDQAEALVVSDDIIVMSKGHIEQNGLPHEIYARPVNRFVSHFIGMVNLIEGKIASPPAAGRGEISLRGENGKDVRIPCLVAEGLQTGDEAFLSVRPENIEALRAPEGPCLEGEVVDAIFLGNYVDCRVQWDDFEWKLQAHPRDHLRKGERVYLRFDPEHTLAVRP